MEQEIWKDIENYNGLYQVSNFGKVKRNGKVLKYGFDHKNYCYVNLSKNGIVKPQRIHRLVAQAFIPNLMNKKEINHIDGNKHNNNVSNLEWVSHKENMIHAIKNNLLSRETLLSFSKMGVEKNRKPIAQIKNGIIVNTYKSVAEAYRQTKIRHISCVANGNRKQAGGFQWKYIKKGI